MSARRRRRTARQTPPEALDPFDDLGPGDLGYRLRDGRTGLDPYDNALEQGRLGGMALKAMFGSPIFKAVAVALIAALVTSFVANGDWTAVGIVVAAAVALFFLWAISKQDLERIQRSRDE